MIIIKTFSVNAYPCCGLLQLNMSLDQSVEWHFVLFWNFFTSYITPGSAAFNTMFIILAANKIHIELEWLFSCFYLVVKCMEM